ncbi:hypothetical protein V8D89_002887 [Ganoderma adspersum]
MDILLTILSLSPPKTVTSIMETCHFLYHEGAKVILQQPVFLRGSEQQDLAQLRFIQVEDLSRCSYVRNLSIYIPTVSEVVASALMVLVPRMCNLVVLSVTELMFKIYPNLLYAFASLRSVKTFAIGPVRDKSCELVRMLQSELVSASIVPASTNQPGPGQRPFFAASCHPLYLLQRSASTLQTLTYSDVQTFTSPPIIIYPKVRQLILCSEDELAPFLPPYIVAFPNLVHLSLAVDTLPPVSGELPLQPPPRNQAQIAVMPQGLTRDALVWRHIETYTGTLSHLQALGITFPIPRLYLTALPGAPYTLALTEVLAYTQPVHLTITYLDQPFSHTPACPDLLTALSSDGASRLRSLALRIDLMAADVDSDFDVGQFWTILEAALTRLQLCALCIVMRDISLPEALTANTSTAAISLPSTDPNALHHNHAGEDVDSHIGTAHGPVDPTNAPHVSLDCPQCAEAARRTSLTLAERTLEDFDAGAFVARLAAAVPTFQRAIVSVGLPSRWGGGAARTVYLGRHDGLMSEMRLEVRNNYLHDAMVRWGMNPQQLFAALARAWYRGARA